MPLPRRISRAIVLVADGVGCGGAPDAADYGDAGADTLGNLSRRVGPLALPHLEALGLGHTTAIAGVGATAAPRGAFGTMKEASAGKDTITGHWEMAGLITERALPTFPDGFPEEILAALRAVAGHRGILGNKTASGTAIIEELGERHMASGDLIVYTSADSVLQIAAHEQVIPLPELYAICERARVIADQQHIGRVIARPFIGAPGHFQRTYNRRDYSLVPPAPTLCDAIVAAGMPVVGVGKIWDIFAGRGVSESLHSEGNSDGMRLASQSLARLREGLLFVNLVDFDMLYGHRNDVPGFYRALRDLDEWLPGFHASLRAGDVAFITADHGNDPTAAGTDHTRERVPLLAFGPTVRPGPLGMRDSFCDLGQTVAAGLGLTPLQHGVSFLDQLV